MRKKLLRPVVPQALGIRIPVGPSNSAKVYA